MKRVFLIVVFAVAACADQGRPRSGHGEDWLDASVRRQAEIPACPPQSKAWCTAGPQDIRCSCIAERSFRAQLNGMFR